MFKAAKWTQEVTSCMGHTNMIHILLSTNRQLHTLTLFTYSSCKACLSVWNWLLSVQSDEQEEEDTEEEVSSVTVAMTGRSRWRSMDQESRTWEEEFERKEKDREKGTERLKMKNQ